MDVGEVVAEFHPDNSDGSAGFTRFPAFDSFREQSLGFLELCLAFRSESSSAAVDKVSQHAHTGRGPFG